MCAQIDNEFYSLPQQENLFIPHYSNNISQIPQEGDTFLVLEITEEGKRSVNIGRSSTGISVIEIAEGVIQAGAMGAVIVSAFSVLPAWIWIGYIGAASSPWIIMMVMCNIGSCG